MEFTTPIWVVLLAPLALREPLTRVGLIAVLLGFLGILVIVRPGMWRHLAFGLFTKQAQKLTPGRRIPSGCCFT